MNRADCLREDRKQLVGPGRANPQEVPPEGRNWCSDTQQAIPMKMVGHVTSSYMSASPATLRPGGGERRPLRMGQKATAPLADGRFIEAEICSSVFYDPKGGAAERGIDRRGMRSLPGPSSRREKADRLTRRAAPQGENE